MCACDWNFTCSAHARQARWLPDYFDWPPEPDPYNAEPEENRPAEFEVAE